MSSSLSNDPEIKALNERWAKEALVTLFRENQLWYEEMTGTRPVRYPPLRFPLQFQKQHNCQWGRDPLTIRLRRILMNFWKPFKFIGRLFKRAFIKLFGRALLIRFASVAKDMLLTELGEIAMTIVSEINFENLSNEEKRRIAGTRILDQTRRSGMDVKDSMIGLMIEIAVQRLKGLVGI